MISSRPLILFPSYHSSDKAKRYGNSNIISKLPIKKQVDKYGPKFEQLQKIIERKNITIQDSPLGINPECALVFEINGDVETFYSAVQKIDGLEWLFDISMYEIEPDENFYLINKHGNRKNGTFNGKLYCLMTNKRAMDELISLWKQYTDNPSMKFQHGYGGFRKVFEQLRDLRYWSSKDRFEETGVLDYWRENLEYNGDENVNFEIELFYRDNPEKRLNAANYVKNNLSKINGKVISECIIPDISYHCLLASLPRNEIELLVEDYEQVELAKVDDIMFFRAVGQISFPVLIEEKEDLKVNDELLQNNGVGENPIIAVFDGLPMQNHPLLADRLIIDDPYDWASDYTVSDMVHGTAMASLVIYGDLNRRNSALNRKVYIRPIMKPVRRFDGITFERVPDDIILVDLIHTSIKRLFDGENPIAPNVKIINLSIGDPTRQFFNTLSPLARLIDWLSFEYKVLFIISAGNHNDNGIDIGISFSEFKRLSSEEREKLLIRAIQDNSRNMRILSPSESINSLTVGATFSDSAQVTEDERFILPYQNSLPSPISALGLGFNRSIKPDIFYSGGRKYVRELFGSTNLGWVNSLSRPPGSYVAFPGISGKSPALAYTFGTSDATAQITHEGAKCYSVLEDIFLSQRESEIPEDFAALLIKAMLVHGASWGQYRALIANALQLTTDKNRVYRWIGNGIPDISRVKECAKNRVTLIGFGSLEKEKAHIYKLPIPFDFSRTRFFRSLTVTLAYFTPTISTRQKYRLAQLWFSIKNHNLLTPKRINTDDRAVKRGTLQHEIFYGNDAVVWNPSDLIEIKVNCAEDASKLNCSINYALMVTFEVAEEIAEKLNMDIYTDIITKVHETIPIPIENIT